MDIQIRIHMDMVQDIKVFTDVPWLVHGILSSNINAPLGQADGRQKRGESAIRCTRGIDLMQNH